MPWKGWLEEIPKPIEAWREAEADGADILLGDGNRKGAVIQPHIITNVKPGMRLWERESFGPREYSEFQ